MDKKTYFLRIELCLIWILTFFVGATILEFVIHGTTVGFCLR
jgi:hypothetical protein